MSKKRQYIVGLQQSDIDSEAPVFKSPLVNVDIGALDVMYNDIDLRGEIGFMDSDSFAMIDSDKNSPINLIKGDDKVRSNVISYLNLPIPDLDPKRYAVGNKARVGDLEYAMALSDERQALTDTEALVTNGYNFSDFSHLYKGFYANYQWNHLDNAVYATDPMFPDRERLTEGEVHKFLFSFGFDGEFDKVFYVDHFDVKGGGSSDIRGKNTGSAYLSRAFHNLSEIFDIRLPRVRFSTGIVMYGSIDGNRGVYPALSFLLDRWAKTCLMMLDDADVLPTDIIRLLTGEDNPVDLVDTIVEKAKEVDNYTPEFRKSLLADVAPQNSYKNTTEREDGEQILDDSSLILSHPVLRVASSVRILRSCIEVADSLDIDPAGLIESIDRESRMGLVHYDIYANAGADTDVNYMQISLYGSGNLKPYWESRRRFFFQLMEPGFDNIIENIPKLLSDGRFDGYGKFGAKRIIQKYQETDFKSLDFNIPLDDEIAFFYTYMYLAIKQTNYSYLRQKIGAQHPFDSHILILGPYDLTNGSSTKYVTRRVDGKEGLILAYYKKLALFGKGKIAGYQQSLHRHSPQMRVLRAEMTRSTYNTLIENGGNVDDGFLIAIPDGELSMMEALLIFSNNVAEMDNYIPLVTDGEQAFPSQRRVDGARDEPGYLGQSMGIFNYKHKMT